jgi:hypothetical protein
MVKLVFPMGSAGHPSKPAFRREKEDEKNKMDGEIF